MGDNEDRGRNDLIKAILRVLPIDTDGQCIVFVGAAGHKYWGDPRVVARRILDALDEAYTNRDMQTEHNYNRHAEDEELF